MNFLVFPVLKRLIGLQAVIAALVCTLFSVYSVTALAQNAKTDDAQTRPRTAVSVITFDVGRLEQNPNIFGQWTEYDFRGVERYKFREVVSKDSILRLRGERGTVELRVDLAAKSISGQWPGHPMAPLYQITSVTPMTIASKPSAAVVAVTPPPESPKAETPTIETSEVKTPDIKAPAVKAPMKDTPSPLLPKAPVKPKAPMEGLAGADPTPKAKIFDPKKVAEVDYGDGTYLRKSDLDWVETTSNNTVFQFKKVAHDASAIYLFDESRAMFIKLDLLQKLAFVSDGEALRQLHELTAIYESKPLIVNVPENTTANRKLSIKERFDCRRKGGIVERAGMLGAERCTVRFSDGGNVCLDSGDCEGKCFTQAETGSENVTGQCQMTDNPFGCRAEVINGVAEFMLCVD